MNHIAAPYLDFARRCNGQAARCRTFDASLRAEKDLAVAKVAAGLMTEAQAGAIIATNDRLLAQIAPLWSNAVAWSGETIKQAEGLS